MKNIFTNYWTIWIALIAITVTAVIVYYPDLRAWGDRPLAEATISDICLIALWGVFMLSLYGKK